MRRTITSASHAGLTEYGRETYSRRMVQHLEMARAFLKDCQGILGAIRRWRYGYTLDQCRTIAVHHLRLALRFANRALAHKHKSYIMKALNSLRGLAPQSAFTCYLGG